MNAEERTQMEGLKKCLVMAEAQTILIRNGMNKGSKYHHHVSIIADEMRELIHGIEVALEKAERHAA